ncbi:MULTISPECIES: xanthine dehydrogenase family protein molybdopterin-binding subunit [unclassified Fusibacter]|uniref:xanthine dehydrogenase family protein molybdopterin-binding subunit n=1 Tax=unclassified Fusibacter TaxID=2624464 RepID=UPI0010102DCC|nr:MULTISPECIES: xanthine dehydrogenase family protein molybdopterin-binding subunit [unclassified Fusibacter]MCK8060384.1 xanthine dehydrogenase family protein molybdopterin-binding subunit [Fusibacter sp. A2]NPE20327.1 xanthine dehydrogenase family protein [Fusibacter sp. A1]RXV63533.1 aldehyde oxidase [Fusibacter sp. A1]
MKITDSVHRVDSADKLRGVTNYIEDIVFDGMMYAKTLRSTVANARIESIEFPCHKEGVFVISGKDAVEHNEVAMIEKDMPIFAEERVTYIGEPIALVVGEDKDVVLEYMSGITVNYIEETPVFDMLSASLLEGHTLTDHTFEKGSLVHLEYDEKFSESFSTSYQEQLYMEKQGVVGTYEDDVVTVYGSLQCPYYILNALKHSFGFDETRLRVIQSATGGAFGGKEEYPSLLACQVAIAAYRLKRPVRLVFDRREDMAFSTKRHPSETQVTSYLKDGRIVGMDFDILLDAGSYLGLSDVVLQRSILTMTGSYLVKNLRVRGRTIKTNNVFTGAFRGFGAPQSMYALELHMNHLADRMNADPLEFRRMHYVKKGDETSTGGIFHENIFLNELTDLLESISDYQTIKRKNEPLVGYGVSVIPHGGGFTGDGEATHIKAVVKLRKETDDCVTILVSNVEMGQGAITTLSKIVASVLDIEMDRVRYETPDTFKVPDSGPTVASRTTMVVGALIAKAAVKLKERMNERGEVLITENFVQPEYIKWDQETLKGNAYMAYSWSALLARVEVDPISYEVSCTDIWGAYDVGIPIDENLLMGQIHGGIVQGLGYALMEDMTSRDGLIEQTAFASYPIPTTMDIPDMHADWIINRYEDGPFGAKAVGELTLVGVAPAVASAVEHAMKIKTNHIPVTPEVIERNLL